MLLKIKDARVYDTRTYRYVYDQMAGRIQRIRIEYLDTVKALDPEEWEVVKAIAELYMDDIRGLRGALTAPVTH